VITSGGVFDGGGGVTSSAGYGSAGGGSFAGGGATRFKFGGGAGGVPAAAGDAYARRRGRTEIISSVESLPPVVKQTPLRCGPTVSSPLVYPRAWPPRPGDE
jgi:hypothetical protein